MSCRIYCKKGIGGIIIVYDEAFQRGLDLVKHKRYEKAVNTFNKILDKNRTYRSPI